LPDALLHRLIAQGQHEIVAGLVAVPGGFIVFVEYIVECQRYFPIPIERACHAYMGDGIGNIPATAHTEVAEIVIGIETGAALGARSKGMEEVVTYAAMSPSVAALDASQCIEGL
jgi:hypothetical protein